MNSERVRDIYRELRLHLMRYEPDRLDWLDDRQDAVQGMIAAVVRGIPLPADLAALLDGELRAHLRIPRKPRAAPGVRFPMSLAEFREMVQIPDTPRTNPAPAAKAGEDMNWAARVQRQLAEKLGDDRANFLTWSDIHDAAWALSAPEGFPPAPERGDRYSAIESDELWRWLLNSWPVIDEAAAYYAREATPVFEAVGPGDMGDRDDFARLLNDGRYDENMRAKGRTPEEWVKSALNSRIMRALRGRVALIDDLVALRKKYPRIGYIASTPEEMDRQAEILIGVQPTEGQKVSAFDALLNLYAKMPPYDRVGGQPSGYGIGYEAYRQGIPLSAQVKRYRDSRAAEEREARERAAKETSAAEAVAGMARRVFVGQPKPTTTDQAVKRIEAAGWQIGSIPKYGQHTLSKDGHFYVISGPILKWARTWADR